MPTNLKKRPLCLKIRDLCLKMNLKIQLPLAPLRPCAFALKIPVPLRPLCPLRPHCPLSNLQKPQQNRLPPTLPTFFRCAFSGQDTRGRSQSSLAHFAICIQRVANHPVPL